MSNLNKHNWNCYGTHWVKYVEIRGFSGPYFPVYRQNSNPIFLYIVDSVHIWGNADTILLINGIICIRESLEVGVFHAVTSIWLEFKKKSFADDLSTKEDNQLTSSIVFLLLAKLSLVCPAAFAARTKSSFFLFCSRHCFIIMLHIINTVRDI